MKICFVCTGNTCRSPMAEYLMKKYLSGCPDVEVRSAGIQALNGDVPSEYSVQVMAEKYALDLSGHRSAGVNEQIMQESDYIYTMTQQHRQMLMHFYPQYADKIATIGEAAGKPENDIPDPYGGSYEDYELTAQVIDNLIMQLAQELRKQCR